MVIPHDSLYLSFPILFFAKLLLIFNILTISTAVGEMLSQFYVAKLKNKKNV